jgi:hypothetical protein
MRSCPPFVAVVVERLHRADDSYRPVVEGAWRASITFRATCLGRPQSVSVESISAELDHPDGVRVPPDQVAAPQALAHVGSLVAKAAPLVTSDCAVEAYGLHEARVYRSWAHVQSRCTRHRRPPDPQIPRDLTPRNTILDQPPHQRPILH